MAWGNWYEGIDWVYLLILDRSFDLLEGRKALQKELDRLHRWAVFNCSPIQQYRLGEECLEKLPRGKRPGNVGWQLNMSQQCAKVAKQRLLQKHWGQPLCMFTVENAPQIWRSVFGLSLQEGYVVAQAWVVSNLDYSMIPWYETYRAVNIGLPEEDTNNSISKTPSTICPYFYSWFKMYSVHGSMFVISLCEECF